MAFSPPHGLLTSVHAACLTQHVQWHGSSAFSGWRVLMLSGGPAMTYYTDNKMNTRTSKTYGCRNASTGSLTTAHASHTAISCSYNSRIRTYASCPIEQKRSLLDCLHGQRTYTTQNYYYLTKVKHESLISFRPTQLSRYYKFFSFFSCLHRGFRRWMREVQS